MTEEEYTRTQTALLQLGQVVAGLDLEGFLAMISRAETMGPIMDPTLYRDAADNIQALKALATTLQTYQMNYEVAQQTILTTMARRFQTDPRVN